MRLQAQKTNHEMHLKEIELAAEIQYQKDMQIRQQQLDLQKQAQQLEHERLLKELQRTQKPGNMKRAPSMATGERAGTTIKTAGAGSGT